MILQQIRETFKDKFNTSGAVYTAPGRVNLIGEHTDYNLGFVLPGAIDKAIYLEIKPNNSNRYQVVSIDFDQETSFEANVSKTAYGWADYILGVVMELKELGLAVPGFDAVFGGNIPLGGGMSSSAALESAFAFALNDIYSLGLTRMELAKIGQMAEHHYAGVRCGIMDQFASLHGQKDRLLKLDCRSLEFETVPFKLDEYKVILLDSNVKHSLASSEYNIRRAQCETGVAAIQKHHPEVKSLRDVNLSMLDEIKSEVEEVVLRRCEYVVEENIRLSEACEALDSNDLKTFGMLMFGSHEGLSSKYEVSCKELDLLASVARKTAGVIGSRMMGGGFGGCTISIVSNEAHDNFIQQATVAFEKEFGKKPHVYDVIISDGAKRLI